jgi:hypothetical protein
MIEQGLCGKTICTVKLSQVLLLKTSSSHYAEAQGCLTFSHFTSRATRNWGHGKSLSPYSNCVPFQGFSPHTPAMPHHASFPGRSRLSIFMARFRSCHRIGRSTVRPLLRNISCMVLAGTVHVCGRWPGRTIIFGSPRRLNKFCRTPGNLRGIPWMSGRTRLTLSSFQALSLTDPYPDSHIGCTPRI